MRHPRLTILLSAVLGLFAACTRPAEDPAAAATTKSVATVNGTPISSEFFDEFLAAATGKPAAEATAEQKNQLLDQLVNMSLAAQAAEKDGTANDPAVKAKLEMMRLQVLAGAMSEKFAEAHPSTDAEIKAEYDSQVANLPKEYKARHILVEQKETAESLIRDLQAGGDFAKLAEKESKDSSAQSGGDLGWFQLQSMVKPFSDAVAALEKGAFTLQPVQTQFGWHVILLEDTRSPSAPEFDAVKDRVDMIVKRKKLEAHLAQLRETAKVQKTL